MQLLLTITTALLGLTHGHVTYEGYKVYTAYPKTLAEMDLLQVLENDKNFDFWSPRNKALNPVTLMVSPDNQTTFEGYLKDNAINHRILIENVANTMDVEIERQSKREIRKRGEINLNAYNRHDEINAYLDQLAQDLPDLVTVETIGRSYEGRDLKIIRISTDRNASKPTIFLDAGIHAREWISPAFALFIISQLVENPNSTLLENIDWILLPVANPDGYEYTWETDRMWRKTRSDGERCMGADGNRNFDFHWMVAGASGNECAEDYGGKTAFSEPEMRAFGDFLRSPNANIVAYLSLHSYGKYLLYPWSWTTDLPDNWEELEEIGNAMNDAIVQSGGPRYTVGNSVDVMYYAAGCSDDYAKGPGGVRVVLVMELPGGGDFGFDLPEAEIGSVCAQTWPAIEVLHRYANELN